VIPVYSQDKKNTEIVFVSGNIYDVGTLEKIPFVNITINRGGQNLLSDQNGHFEVLLNISDTITFSRIGFETSVVTLNNTHLKADTIYLDI